MVKPNEKCPCKSGKKFKKCCKKKGLFTKKNAFFDPSKWKNLGERHPSFRFAVGDRVEGRVGEYDSNGDPKWTPGTVRHVNHIAPDGRHFPYQCLLDYPVPGTDRRIVAPPSDTNDFIRPLGFTSTSTSELTLGFTKSAAGLAMSTSSTITSELTSNQSPTQNNHYITLSTTIINSTTTNATKPTLVLVHGLDSTRFTWNPFIARCDGKYNIVAVDLRGHGESPLGEEKDFTASNLAADIRHTLFQDLQINKPIVLLGHSMGGRVAMQYGADYPEDLAALIIEDMDVKPRTSKEFTDMKERRDFNRSFNSWNEVKSHLLNWYQDSRIDGWKKDGRIFEREDKSWWSGINPMAQCLALQMVLSENVGIKEYIKCGENQIPLHCFVAGEGSAVDRSSLLEMTTAVPNTIVSSFDGAAHSIHNTCANLEFDLKVDDIYSSL